MISLYWLTVVFGFAVLVGLGFGCLLGESCPELG
jgi:hypothetical protein